MRVVSKRTGLSPHVIRVWERRYGAVEPVRTPSNRRVYRDEDLERLTLLHQATLIGHGIGQAAKLSNDRLRSLLKEAPSTTSERSPSKKTTDRDPGFAYVEHCLAAVRDMDGQALEAELQEAVVALGAQGLLTHVAAPLGQQVGELWLSGEITAAHEHFLTGTLRSFLASHSQQFSIPRHAPAIIVATPAEQIHELGAIIVAAAAGNYGWRVIYLGANLPAAEIAGVARDRNVRVVALSIVYPEDDPGLPNELRQLRANLPRHTELIVGGRGAQAYADTLVEIGARVANTLDDLFPALEATRKASARR